VREGFALTGSFDDELVADPGHGFNAELAPGQNLAQVGDVHVYRARLTVEVFSIYQIGHQVPAGGYLQ